MSEIEILLAMIVILVLTTFGCMVWYLIMILTELRQLEERVKLFDRDIAVCLEMVKRMYSISGWLQKYQEKQKKGEP